MGGITQQRTPTATNFKDKGAVGDGVTDATIAINAALAGGGTVFGPAGTFLISSPLIIPSNTNLILDPGCTITLAAGSNCNMLKNSSTVPSRTVTDAVTTAASATITSATANFTGGDVGKWVGIIGAGPNYGLGSAPSSLYASISSVTNSTTAVLSAVATLSTTGATLNVWPGRDSNITVSGGTWNHGNVDAISQQLGSHCFLFRRVDGLVIRDMLHQSQGSSHIGGRYALAIGDCTKVLCDDLDFNTAGDGVHFTGPGQYLTARNIRGTTGDGHVAVTGIDGQSIASSLLGDVNGNFSDILIENVQCNASWAAMQVNSGQTSGAGVLTITRFKAKDFYGTTGTYGMIIHDYGGTTSFSGEIENVSLQPATNQPSVQLAATAMVEVTLKGIKWPNVATPTSGVINIGNTPTSVIIKDVEFLYSGSTGGPIVLFATTFCRNLVIDGVAMAQNPSGSLDLIRFTSATTSISSLRINNVSKSGSGGGNIISCTATNYTIKAALSNIYTASGNVFSATADSTNTQIITAENLHTNGSLFSLQSPATIYLSNVFHTQTSGNAINAADAAATPVRVYGNNVSLSSGTLFTRSASQVLSAMGLTLSTDLSILTPTDQDIVNNSNGVLACGAGLAIFHTGGTGNGWKNLYSGVTY